MNKNGVSNKYGDYCSGFKNTSTMKINLYLFLAIVASLSFNACDDNVEPADCSTTANTATPFTNTPIENMRQAMVAFRSSLSEDLRNQGTVCLELYECRSSQE